MNKKLVTRHGSKAKDMYTSVGLALSFWEGSEDVQKQLFSILCGRAESIAVETFCTTSSRDLKYKMLLSVLEKYAWKMTEEEISSVKEALKALKDLAQMRNQIAHGYTCDIEEEIDTRTVMKGVFLVSTISPLGLVSSRESNRKYAHTAAEIDKWRDTVREHRGVLMDVLEAVVQRHPLEPIVTNGTDDED